jgi:hypothetical protein
VAQSDSVHAAANLVNLVVTCVLLVTCVSSDAESRQVSQFFAGPPLDFNTICEHARNDGALREPELSRSRLELSLAFRRGRHLQWDKLPAACHSRVGREGDCSLLAPPDLR